MAQDNKTIKEKVTDYYHTLTDEGAGPFLKNSVLLAEVKDELRIVRMVDYNPDTDQYTVKDKDEVITLSKDKIRGYASPSYRKVGDARGNRGFLQRMELDNENSIANGMASIASVSTEEGAEAAQQAIEDEIESGNVDPNTSVAFAYVSERSDARPNNPDIYRSIEPIETTNGYIQIGFSYI